MRFRAAKTPKSDGLCAGRASEISFIIIEEWGEVLRISKFVIKLGPKNQRARRARRDNSGETVRQACVAFILAVCTNFGVIQQSVHVQGACRKKTSRNGRNSPYKRA